MGKIEKEYKVLNIDIEKIKDGLIKLGAKSNGKIEQKICVYDLPTLYYRFLEIRELLKSNNVLLVNTNLSKLKTLLNEYEDLVDDKELDKVLKSCNIKSLNEVYDLDKESILNILNNINLENSIQKYMINPNKWIRLRQSNEKIELCTKHVKEKSNKGFQDVYEIEFEVSSFEETNNFLDSIGLSLRSRQEKIRYEYKYKDADIEIDIWPLLDPYLEIECDNDNTIKEILNNLNIDESKLVSLNTEQLYKEKNINIHEISELKFN